MATTANCEAIQEQVIALADGELDAAASDIVRAHLTECADCRALLADIEQMRTALPTWKVDEKNVQGRIEESIYQMPQAPVNATPSVLQAELHSVLNEMRAMRQEMAALRAEITELRREQREANARYSTPAVRTTDFLMPYAEPNEVPLHLLS